MNERMSSESLPLGPRLGKRPPDNRPFLGRRFALGGAGARGARSEGCRLG
jgi:hypothetical protein